MRLALTFMAIFFLMLAGVAPAQESPVDKGSYQLGGGISFSSWGGDLYENGDGDGETIFEFDPFFNYFVANNIAIGGRLDFSSDSQGDYKASGFGIGPQVEYFFKMGQKAETKGSIFPYIGAAFTYSSTTSNTGEPGADDVKFTGTEIAFFGGAHYMLNNNVSLFGQLEYDMHSMKLKEPVEGDSRSGTVFGFFTGFTFFLP